MMCGKLFWKVVNTLIFVGASEDRAVSLKSCPEENSKGFTCIMIICIQLDFVKLYFCFTYLMLDY